MSSEKDEGRWHNLSFRIFGDNLPDAEDMEARLQLPTSFSGRKGGHMRDNPRYATHATNFWGWQFTTNSDIHFDEQISQALDILEPKSAALKELLTIPGTEAQFVLGYGSESGQGGAYLPASLVMRIGALGLAMSIHMYPPSEWKSESEVISA